MINLRHDTVSALAAAHDHFIYSKKLWHIAEADVRFHVRRVVLNSNVTGSRVKEQDLSKIANDSVNKYLPSATIQHLVSLTETFLSALPRRAGSESSRPAARTNTRFETIGKRPHIFGVPAIQGCNDPRRIATLSANPRRATNIGAGAKKSSY